MFGKHFKGEFNIISFNGSFQTNNNNTNNKYKKYVEQIFD